MLTFLGIDTLRLKNSRGSLYCIYVLTSWSRDLLEKLTGFQLVKKFPAFYGTQRFITEFTSARHLSLSWAVQCRLSEFIRVSWFCLSPSPPPGATQPIVGVYFTALNRALASSRTRLLDHTQRRATVGRTPLNEWSVRRRDLYLTTHNRLDFVCHSSSSCPA